MSSPSPISSDATEERLAAIERRLSGISEVPWCLDERYPRKVYCDDSLGSLIAECDSNRFNVVPSSARDANAALIANAPADLTWLVSELRRSREDAKRLEYVMAKGFVPFWMARLRKLHGLPDRRTREHIDLAMKRDAEEAAASPSTPEATQ